MMLALALAVMTVAVLATVIAPLVRGTRPAPGRAAFDRAVYRDQLGEIERDVARGLVPASQAATARLEIERRLLAAADAAPTDAAGPAARSGGSPRLAAVLAFAVSVAAGGLYLALGAPNVPDQPFSERAAERAQIAASGHGDLEKTIAGLADRLKQKPDDTEGWLMLARAEAALSHWQKSAAAYGHALTLTKGRPDISSAYGETLVMAADGIVTPAAHDAFAATLERDPQDGPSRFYLALADAQAGNVRKAIDAWQKLAREAPANSPLRKELATRIAEAAKAAGLPVPELAPPAPASAADGGAPGADDMAAAAQMPPEQREAMIHSMVERLAEKLDANPDDLEGWLRLARSYGVLHEPEKAADAYEHAARLKPDDPSILLGEAQMLLAGRRPEEALSPRVVTLLRRVETLDPDQPATLWYLGLAEAQGGHFAEAARHWQHLLGLLPADGPEHKTVAQAIATIENRLKP